MEKLRELVGQERPTIAQVLKQFEGKYGRELEHFVYCIENNLPIEEATTDYLKKHPVDRSMIDSALMDGLVTFHILTTQEGVDWATTRENTESFLDYLRDRTIALNGGKKRRPFFRRKE